MEAVVVSDLRSSASPLAVVVVFVVVLPSLVLVRGVLAAVAVVLSVAGRLCSVGYDCIESNGTTGISIPVGPTAG